jgi:Hermes transposase DNA-binding domain
LTLVPNFLSTFLQIEDEACIETAPNAAISIKLRSNIYKLSRKRTHLRSVAWEVFFPIQDENEVIIPNVYACVMCKKVVRLTSKSTTPLLNHSCVKNYNKKQTETSIVVKVDVDDRKEVGVAFNKFFVQDSQPMQIIEGAGFREMIKCILEMGHKYGKDIDVEDLIPSQSMLSLNVTEMKEKHDAAIRTELQEHAKGGYSLTSAVWEDEHNSEKFLGLTVCYMKNRELVNYTLAVKSIDSGTITGDNIAKQTLAILQDYGLDGPYTDKAIMVTNRSPTMTSVSQCLNLDRLNCTSDLIDNTLSVAVEEAGEPITTLLKKCRSLVLFMKKAAEQYTFETSSKSSCPTRWYSYYFMCKSVLLNLSKLVAKKVLNDKRERVDYVLLKQLTALLGVFNEVTDILEATEKPTIHLVYPSITHLEGACAPNETDDPAIANLKINILKRIEDVFRANISSIHRATVLLNPLSNQLRSLNETESEDAIKFVKTAMKQVERDANEGSGAFARLASTNYESLSEFLTVSEVQGPEFSKVFNFGFAVTPMAANTPESVEQELNR